MMIPPETKIPDCFQSGPIEGVTTRPIKAFSDHRGWLMELFREDEIPSEVHPVMAYLSETLPGIARGPHEHRMQTDYFAFVGPGEFTVYLWDIRAESPTWGNCIRILAGDSHRCVIVVPPGVVHAYKNSGPVPGWVFNLPNQLYAGKGRSEPVDEVRHENDPDSPFLLD